MLYNLHCGLKVTFINGRRSLNASNVFQKFPPFNTQFIVWRAAAAAYRALMLLGDTAKGDTAKGESPWVTLLGYTSNTLGCLLAPQGLCCCKPLLEHRTDQLASWLH